MPVKERGLEGSRKYPFWRVKVYFISFTHLSERIVIVPLDYFKLGIVLFA